MIERKRVCDWCHQEIERGETYVQVSSDLRRDDQPPSTCTSIVARDEKDLHTSCAVSNGYLKIEELMALRSKVRA